MKIINLFSFGSSHQIWRLLITDSNKLLIETRDVQNKEAYFNCLEIETGREVFTNYQFDEKFWIGVEEIYNDVIYLHKFAKPDLPGHKGIIAFEINSQRVLWENPDFSFLFIYCDKIYVYRQKFENRDYYEVDCNTGQIIKELGDDFFEINKLSELAATEKNFSQYLFPTPYDEELTSNNSIKKIVSNEIKDLEIVGDVEYTQFDNMLLMNYYERLIGKPLINKFRAFDLEKSKEIFNEVLSSNANAYVPDSFFVYKNLLILLIEKTGLKIYKLN